MDDIFSPTKFRGCVDKETGEVTCVISSADCFNTEDWIPVLDRCRCSDVKIGMCQSAEEPSSCVISSADCDHSAFSPARSNIDCRLCPNTDTTVFENVRKDVVPVESVVERTEPMAEKEEEPFEAGEIVGAGVGGLMTLLFGVVGLWWVVGVEDRCQYLLLL